MPTLHIENMAKVILKNNLVVLIMALVAFSTVSLSFSPAVYGWPVEAANVATVSVSAKHQLLQQYSYKLWQRINALRRDPVKQLTALGIDVDQVAIALGDEAWVLYQGLPPFTWNNTIEIAAQAHGAEMLEQLYYSEIGVNGQDVLQRLEGCGLQAQSAEESLGLLMFSNYVAIDHAVDFLLQNIVQDDLAKINSGGSVLFSQEYTEVGIALLADNVQLFADDVNLYLAVIDCATPEQEVEHAIGACDTGQTAMFRSNRTNFNQLLRNLGGAFQLVVPAEGGELMLLNDAGQVLSSAEVTAGFSSENQFIDFDE